MNDFCINFVQLVRTDMSFDKYKQIDEIKQGLIDKIDYLTSINVVIPEFAEE